MLEKTFLLCHPPHVLGPGISHQCDFTSWEVRLGLQKLLAPKRFGLIFYPAEHPQTEVSGISTFENQAAPTART